MAIRGPALRGLVAIAKDASRPDLADPHEEAGKERFPTQDHRTKARMPPAGNKAADYTHFGWGRKLAAPYNRYALRSAKLGRNPGL